MKLREYLIKIACSILGGVLLALAVPDFSLFTAPLALLPLFILLFTEKKENFICKSVFYVWVFGFTFELIAFFWVSQPIVYFSSFPDYVGYPLFVLISASTSVYFIFLLSPVIFYLYLKHKQYPNNIPVYFVALLVTSFEILIPRFFNWSIGQISNNLYFNQLCSLFGCNTGTFFIVFTNLTFAHAFSDFKNRGLLKKTILLNVCIWTSIFIFGYCRVLILNKKILQSNTVRIAYIQPNFTFQELASKRIDATNAREISLGTVIQMSSVVISNSLAYDNKRPDLLVWPESVAPEMIFENVDLKKIVNEYSQIWGVPILLQGTIEKIKNPEDTYYSVWSISKIMTSSGFENEQFEKWVPIPFGESFPLEKFFPKIGIFYRNIIRNASKVEVGTNYKALNVQNKFHVAPLICFDSIYKKLPYLQATRGNADLFVNQANFMWMVNSNAGSSFGYIDRARAIENARTMFMVSNTGPTMAFDPLGRTIYGPTKIMSSDSGFVDFPLYKGRTLFSYVYDWPILILTLISFGYMVILRLRSRSS